MDEVAKANTIVLIAIMIVLIGFSSSIKNTEENIVFEKEIYTCDAPDGKYWTDTHGNVLYITTDLQNSYVVKYFCEGELKTIILSATDDNVHLYLFENGTDTMSFEKHYTKVTQSSWLGTDFWEDDIQYFIYVPDPYTMR